MTRLFGLFFSRTKFDRNITWDNFHNNALVSTPAKRVVYSPIPNVREAKGNRYETASKRILLFFVRLFSIVQRNLEKLALMTRGTIPLHPHPPHRTLLRFCDGTVTVPAEAAKPGWSGHYSHRDELDLWPRLAALEKQKVAIAKTAVRVRLYSHR